MSTLRRCFGFAVTLLLLAAARDDVLGQERARWQIGFNAIAGSPQGDFRENLSDTRWGGSGYFTYRLRDTALRLGGELGIFANGREDIDFRGFARDEFELTNSIYFARFLARLQPVYGRWSPYVEGVVGLSGFETTLDMKDCTGYCDFNTISSNTTYSAGGGAGLSFRLTRDEQRESGFSIEMGMRYLFGGETEYYLPSDLPALANGLDPTPQRSRTNLVTLSAGVVFDF